MTSPAKMRSPDSATPLAAARKDHGTEYTMSAAQGPHRDRQVGHGATGFASPDQAADAQEFGRPVCNRFLAALSPDEFSLIQTFLTPVMLGRNTVLYEASKVVDWVYFIESGVVSRITRSPIDGSVEVAMVGSSGFIGLSAVIGTMGAFHRTVVLIPGTALRIAASDLRAVMEACPAIRQHLLRYMQVLMLQKAQVSFCNAKHQLQARLARWLLSAHDEVGADELPITHSLLARMLGVRREGVSHVMKTFQAAGAIEGCRGAVTIARRDLLKGHSCACYSIIHGKLRWNEKLPQYRHQV